MKCLSIKCVGFVFILHAFILPSLLFAKTVHQVHFENTDHELHVFRISGAEDGKTLMIMGGVQGDEPGGYLAADLYADLALKKGNLIVVPRANFLSIIKNQRAINRDMNRRFANKKDKKYYEDRVVKILQSLMSKSDYFLNLHEGSGFYSDKWESRLVNPMRYGQSIIADADTYISPTGKEVFLGNIARRVISLVNEGIENKRHHFKFSNHKTFEKNSKHLEQRMSATFYALSKHSIPAFGVETSKLIKDLELKVRYHSMIINTFMDELGIVPENPKVAFAPPRLQSLLLSVNGKKHLVSNGAVLDVVKGDKVKLLEVNANYERGISVDLLGIGAANDLNKEFVVTRAIDVIVKKDSFKCGGIKIVPATLSKNIMVDKKTSTPRFKYLVVDKNGAKYVLKNGETLNVVRGDILRLVDVVADNVNEENIKVNFVGFVADKRFNKGEDRGAIINTAKDLWVKYSKGKKGERYQIKISYNKNKFATVFTKIEEPFMDYIVLKGAGGERRCYANNEVITLPSRHSPVHLVDVKTNVSGNDKIKVFVVGSGKTRARKRPVMLAIGKPLPYSYFEGSSDLEYELKVKRGDLVLGLAKVRLGKSLASLDPK